ncbi:hypothetical protein LshimejAT787_0802260 [Lyophyllum shimeji]|uniref:Uncharacterized protein n=1 Tax=Lyophyllum shimeji TaxID=47721 RepID=A0A9P3PQV9_LYOSH|nr:hypothetical protein LshimejAT787_0802260 [Lyophyllum shimeji]
MSYVYPSQLSQFGPATCHSCTPACGPVSSNILWPDLALHPPAIPISTYSTLAGALDFPSVTSSSSKKRADVDRTAERLPPGMGRTWGTTSHPPSQHDTRRYKERSGTHSQTLHTAPSRSIRGIHADERPPLVPKSLPTGPTNHVLVPQPEYHDDEVMRWYSDPRFWYAPITFQSENIPGQGVRLGEVASSPYPPSIVGAEDAVFAGVSDREIKMWLLWPGYSAVPMQKRMKTQGGRITRELALRLIANLILECMYELHKSKIPVEQGYTEWTIGPRGDKKQEFVGEELFITRLVHRGGSNWQPEVWAPRRL